MSTQLFTKQGRRYVPWGNADDRWDADVMAVGTFRLVHCPAPGHYRYSHDVTPDTAAFVAACELAAVAMERAILDAATHRPSASASYTPEQQVIIERFRQDMVATGGVLPVWWQTSSAREIAQAGIDAVRQVLEVEG